MTHGFLSGGGEMGALMRAHDWSASPLGAPATWPQSLRTTVSLMLNSRYPMFIAWGPGLGFLYNDGYAPILGARHGHALGRPFREVWSEIWHDVGPIAERALAGEATFHEDMHLVMERNGFPEDTWYTFSYSPVRDESGGIGGMFCACTETTDEVLARRKGVEERERLRQMFEQAPGFMAMLRGPDHVFELVNTAYMQLIGHRDVMGRPVREALPEIEGQGFFEILDGVYRTGEPFIGRAFKVGLQRTPDAPVEERFVDLVYQPITGADGRVTGIFVEGADVTERVVGEAALRENERLLRTVLESVSDCFYAVDSDWRYIIFNRASEKYFGVSRDQVIGRSVWDLFPQLRGTEYEYHTRRAMEQGIAAVFETQSRTWPDRTVELRVGPMEGGGISVALTDVTERRAAAQRLLASQRQLSAIFAQTTAGLGQVDLTGRFTLVNDRFCEIAGRSREELLGLRMQDITHPDDLGENVPLFDRATVDGTPYVIEKRYIRPDGSTVWVNNSVSVIHDDEGQPYGVLAATLDVTARKRSEEHQQLLINELNHRVKNTLAIVQGIAAQSLKDERVPQQVRRAFEGRLMALAAAHNVLTRENWESASIRQIVSDAVAPYSGQTRRFEIEGPDLRLVPKTAVSLALAVHELSTNAVKYGALSTDEGGVEISWRAEDRRLRLLWREAGGPPVVAPARRGFGTRMIERGLASELGGEVRIEFNPGGVTCMVDAPLPDAQQ